MKLLNTSALALAISLAGPIAAYAQTAAPTIPYHHSHVHRFQGPHHYVRHRFVAHNQPRPQLPRRGPPPGPQPLRPFRSAWLSRISHPIPMARVTKTD